MSSKKPPERRQRRNTRDIGRLSLVPDREPPPPAPKPTKGQLLASTRDWWADIWASDVSALWDRRSDMAGLRRLCLLIDERERALRAYQTQRSSTGSTGQLVVNPFAKEIASLDGRISALEAQFGLTPKARLDLGVTFGAAAHSLEELARKVEDATSDDPDDPREAVIDTTATEA